MADNTPITPGSGENIATDDLVTLNGVSLNAGSPSGIKAQRVKPVYGADGDANDVSLTTPLPMALMGSIAHNYPKATVNALGGVYQYRRGPLVISDMFDPTGGIDVNRWVTGGTAPPSIVAYSGMTFTTGTTISASSKIVSIAAYNQVTSSEVTLPVQLEATLTTNNHRFWGFGTEPGTWAAATPIQDGWGFEVTTAGQLRAVIYSNAGVVSSANIATPTAVLHTYSMIYRIGQVHFYIDGVWVCVLNGLPLSIETMYLRLHSINATSSPGVAPTFVVAGAVVRDGENLIQQIADPIYQHRRARVDAAGNLQVVESSLSLTQVTGSIIASTTTITAGAGSDIGRAGSVTVYISGTHAGVNVIFEQSADGTNWYATMAQRTDTSAMTTAGATGVLASNSLTAWDVAPLLGTTQFRVRATAWTSGSAAVIIAPAVRAVEIAPSLGPSSAVIGAVSSKNTGTTPATLATVSTSTTSVSLLAANASRLGCTIYNDGSTVLYVALTSSAATTTAYTVQIPNLGYYEVPPSYSGDVTGILLSGTGKARVTSW